MKAGLRICKRNFETANEPWNAWKLKKKLQWNIGFANEKHTIILILTLAKFGLLHGQVTWE
jgi:hypothetical protein